MKVYLAARYGRREELVRARVVLEAAGHEVTSRWLDVAWSGGSVADSAHAPLEERERWCLVDLEDVLRSEVIASFTEDPSSGLGSRGGRHVEFGYALAMGKTLVVVGPRENVFHHHPRVAVVADVAGLLDRLATAGPGAFFTLNVDDCAGKAEADRVKGGAT